MILRQLLDSHFLVFRKQFGEALGQWNSDTNASYAEIISQFEKCNRHNNWRTING
jgi:hypothetical protein